MEYFSWNYWQHTFHNPNYTPALQMNILGSHKYISHAQRPLLLLIGGNTQHLYHVYTRKLLAAPPLQAKVIFLYVWGHDKATSLYINASDTVL